MKVFSLALDKKIKVGNYLYISNKQYIKIYLIFIANFKSKFKMVHLIMGLGLQNL